MKIYLAIPVQHESENIPGLLKCLQDQAYQNFECVFCVNQDDAWWDNPGKREICDDNRRSINILNEYTGLNITVIDRSSRGEGWQGKRGGVGWARKEAFDLIDRLAEPDDIIVSMDADTNYPVNYLESITRSFTGNPDVLGMAVPYYHPLANSINDRLILRYEIYMRYYLLNMFRIGNPYAYTALGSAMAVPIWALRKVGGITPMKSGEDFYFLQKLVKSGKLLVWSDTIAYPSSRFSDRVFFGTGPALIKGNTGDWSSYPLYKAELFDRVGETFRQFGSLFTTDSETPMDAFLKKQFNTPDLWRPLRENYRDRNNFIKACMIKVDGLRILQFLKSEQKRVTAGDQVNPESIKANFSTVINRSELEEYVTGPLEKLTIEQLSGIREILFKREQILRKQITLTGI